MEFEKTNFQNKIEANEPASKTDRLKRFEPNKITTNRPENPMRQPANLGMFYGLSDSRILDDKARLPRNQSKLPKG
ncbi:hypothetical protein AKH03_20995 [Vibrio parahaemolyticus]|nr:hypothetical protein AKH03_20995 [Vibrio parahaemolyticus]ODW84126.1 hypothetical protein BBL93_08015 [Vibrio parahaemolyticus]